MKKAAPAIFLLAVSCLILFIALVFCIVGIYDINRTLANLADDTGASGIDFMGIGWGYGIGLFTASLAGLLFSSITRKMLTHKFLQKIAYAAIVLFSLLIAVSVFLFYV